MAERAAQRRLYAGGGLAPVGFQELVSRGGVEEETAHDHRRPFGAAGDGHILNVARAKRHMYALRAAAAAGGKLYLAHGGDGGKRLATKAHRADGLKPLRVMQLRGGVAQKGNARVLRRHAAAVVRHADVDCASALYLYYYVLCARVNGVFHKLLNYGGGALHHLAGGDHVRHERRENINNRHSS